MTTYSYNRAEEGPAPFGLVILQVDETIEQDMRRMMPPDRLLFVARVPSGEDVTPDSLNAMRLHLTSAAQLLPQEAPYAAIGYGCTSATAQIGAGEVARLIGAGAQTMRVTDPLTALIAACSALAIRRLAFLSPYTADVSDKLRQTLRAAGINTPSFGSFEEANEAAVARIAGHSIIGAATDLVKDGQCDGIFLSCTNLRTLDVIERLEARTNLPCLSSNQVLAWHLSADAVVPGQLGRTRRIE